MFAAVERDAGSARELLASVARGPAEALFRRRLSRQETAEQPGAFCAALLGRLHYSLPENVDRPTWQVALRHFAEAEPTETEFRRLLEGRAERGRPANLSSGGRDRGGQVAEYLLREWERYQLALQLASVRPGRSRRTDAKTPARPAYARSRGRERAALRAMLQRFGSPRP
jgi:hypothetical protein